MKIRFLGTAAAEAMPALFCDCDNCRRARELGGKNYRTRSQTVIDTDLMIDLPCDTLYHIRQFDVDLIGIKHLLITHTHSDHFYPNELYWLIGNGYSHPPKNWHGITVYGNEHVEAGLKEILELSEGKVKFNKIKPFEPIKVGDYKVTALNAVHGAPQPYIYIIEKNEKTFLYAHDSDMFPEDTWDYIKKIILSFQGFLLIVLKAHTKNLII